MDKPDLSRAFAYLVLLHALHFLAILPLILRFSQENKKKKDIVEGQGSIEKQDKILLWGKCWCCFDYEVVTRISQL